MPTAAFRSTARLHLLTTTSTASRLRVCAKVDKRLFAHDDDTPLDDEPAPSPPTGATQRPVDPCAIHPRSSPQNTTPSHRAHLPNCHALTPGRRPYLAPWPETRSIRPILLRSTTASGRSSLPARAEAPPARAATASGRVKARLERCHALPKCSRDMRPAARSGPASSPRGDRDQRREGWSSSAILT